MPKLVLAGIGAAAFLGLTACDYDKQEYNDAAGYNAEETNYSSGNADDYGNMTDMNMADNAMVNGADANAAAGSTDNGATTNGY